MAIRSRSEAVRPETLPTTVVLNREGEVIHRNLGSTDAGWEELTAVLAERTVGSAP